MKISNRLFDMHRFECQFICGEHEDWFIDMQSNRKISGTLEVGIIN